MSEENKQFDFGTRFERIHKQQQAQAKPDSLKNLRKQSEETIANIQRQVKEVQDQITESIRHQANLQLELSKAIAASRDKEAQSFR